MIIKGGLNDFVRYMISMEEIIELQLTDNQLNIIDLPHGIKGIILVSHRWPESNSQETI